MSTILITGGTGMVGKQLCEMLLGKGYEVIVLSRNAKQVSDKPELRYAHWDVDKQTIDADAIQRADHIIHLAGAGVADERWTKERKEEILNSRVNSGRLLVKSLQELPNKVQSLVSASAIGWYGPDTALSRQNGFVEEAPAANDFLGNTCRLWEESTAAATGLGKRVVHLRMGIVLGEAGGALAEFKKPLKGGIAAILGGGQQVVSWIHLEDICRLYIYAMENTAVQGPYNAVAPKPVTNQALTLALAEQLRGKFYVPVHVPAIALKWIMGEMSVEVLKSATVNCKRITAAGFDFTYPDITTALQNLTQTKSK